MCSRIIYIARCGAPEIHDYVHKLRRPCRILIARVFNIRIVFNLIIIYILTFFNLTFFNLTFRVHPLEILREASDLKYQCCASYPAFISIFRRYINEIFASG